MIKKPVIFLGITLCAFCHIASADHPTIAFGSEAAGPVSTIPAIPMPAETWGFGLRAEIINNDAFSTEQLEDFSANGLEGVHSIDKIRSTSVSLSYGMTDDFSVNARLPYIERINIRESEIEDGVPEAHTQQNGKGVLLERESLFGIRNNAPVFEPFAFVPRTSRSFHHGERVVAANQAQASFFQKT